MDAVSTFESSLAEQSTVHRTTAEGVSEAIAAAVEPPAVGVPLDIADVSLADADVALDPSLAELEAATTGITPTGLGIATYGTVTLPSTEAGGELVSLYVDRHVAVLAASDLVPDMAEAYDRIATDVEAGLSTQILATGPSVTADMGDLVRGVHGPHETHVVVVEDR